MDNKSITCSSERSCPFMSPSGEAYDSWFIGRKDVITELIKSAVQPNGTLTNCSIIGLPRIGKSSLLKCLLNSNALLSRYEKLIVIYMSMDQCELSRDIWGMIGSKLVKALKRKFGDEPGYLDELREELEYCDISLDAKSAEIDYEYLCELSRCMNECGYKGLVLIDEFDNFSSIADKTVVGNFRTLFNGAEFGIRTILASRRTVDRIEQEVSGAINVHVSTLAPLFQVAKVLKPFDEVEMNEYWDMVGTRIGHSVSQNYRDTVCEYVGGHPLLLNLLNWSYWMEKSDDSYLWNNDKPSFENQINIIYEAFSVNIWNEIERWNLHTPLILLSWGPQVDVNGQSKSEIEKYGLISDTICSKPLGPISIAISSYFTDWMMIKRHSLPFNDIWSATERNLRSLILYYCDVMYQGDEEKMIEQICNDSPRFEKYTDEKYTASSRFRRMKYRRDNNLKKYPDMSPMAIDYSDPSDFPEIFFRRYWGWFSTVFNGEWPDWKSKFDIMGEIRNFHAHNNLGVPVERINVAKRHCQDVNNLIEQFLSKQ